MSRSQALHKLLIVTGLLFFLLLSLHSNAQTVHHNLAVEIFPSLKMLKGHDTIKFPAGTTKKFSFLIHKNFTLKMLSLDDKLIVLHPATQQDSFVEYGIELGTLDQSVAIEFSGVIFDPVINESSTGLISSEGASLSGESFWYPAFTNYQTSFEINVTTPADWMSLTQGQLTSTQTTSNIRTSRFVEIYPQEEIYLIAGPFFQYETQLKNDKKVRVLLRKDEPTLAQNFLASVPEYLEYYSSQIAPYPYSTFTVVENFWETGFGMPSFTLLGPSVIRLPFIFNSSLPHEILHNWWGNSVYVNSVRGNWCEGLTSYMADYWQQEKAGQDRNYRLSALVNFNDFVSNNPKNDFPLKNFKARHSPSSQAIGYNKSMMLFHMLEFRFGKDLFQKSLQDFYQKNLFKKASFNDIQISFEQTTGTLLQPFFDQWLERTGAPQIELGDVKSMKWHEGNFSTTYSLSLGTGPIYDLMVPVIWKLESGEEVRQIARLSSKNQIYSMVSNSRPIEIAIDPDFHVFRQLYLQEQPATLSNIFGGQKTTFIIDSKNSETSKFAQIWSKNMSGEINISEAGTTLALPDQGNIVLIGDRSEFAELVKSNLPSGQLELSAESIKLSGQEFILSETSTLVVVRSIKNPRQTLSWVRWSKDNNATEWANRLTHYGSFGVLAFKGRPAVLKATWTPQGSPLKRSL